MKPFVKAVIFLAEFIKLYRSVANDKLSIEEIKEKARHFREKLLSLGVTYVKFGQMLSVRYDLLSSEVCEELQELLDNEPPLEFAYVKDF